MQHQMGMFQEELKKAMERLATVEEEKYQALNELREMKKVSEEATMRVGEALSAQAQGRETSRAKESERASIESAKKRDQAWQLELEMVKKQHALDVEALNFASQELSRARQELILALEAKDAALKKTEEARNMGEVNAERITHLSAELSSFKESLTDSSKELEVRDKNIESLKLELDKVKHIGGESAEKEAWIEKLKQELSNIRESESQTMGFLSESRLRAQTLELEVKKAKESETKMYESLLCQAKQLEQTEFLLEETKLEATSLQEMVGSLEDLVGQSSRDLDVSHHCLEKAKLDIHSIKETVESLKSELKAAKEGEELASSKASSLTHEMGLIKNEMKLATEAEEKSKRAMDDLALVLIEVTKEANEVKEKLSLTQSELENAREEAERSKQMVKTTEEKYQGLLEEARKEIDQFKCLVDRLKLEAEDSILAWNGKELEFVNCIKRTEEESTASKQENSRLVESLRVAENTAKVVREENCKLRDILKQAINESAVAKEAAEIARTENSQFKDSLLDKDDALRVLTQENERLRINEAAALENIKELKRLLSTTSTKDMKAEDRDLGVVIKKQNATMKEHKDYKKITEVLTLKFEELKIPNAHRLEDEDPEKAEMLKGSIFDVADSPEPVVHHDKTTSVCTDDGDTMNLEDFDHLDGNHLDDTDNDRSSQRKKKALLHRFGSILRKTSFHKREPSVG